MKPTFKTLEVDPLDGITLRNERGDFVATCSLYPGLKGEQTDKAKADAAEIAKRCRLFPRLVAALKTAPYMTTLDAAGVEKMVIITHLLAEVVGEGDQAMSPVQQICWDNLAADMAAGDPEEDKAFIEKVGKIVPSGDPRTKHVTPFDTEMGDCS